jgi:hypothetical protein
MNWLDLQDVAKWISSPGRAHESPKGFPMFQTKDVKHLKKSEAGLPGDGEVLIANNMDTVWFVETRDHPEPVSREDCQQFLQVKEELMKKHPELYVRGILLTSSPIQDSADEPLDAEECYLLQVGNN